jgi:tight adherence protein C
MALLAAAAVFLTVMVFVMAFSTPGPDAVRARVAGLATSRRFEPGEQIPSFGDRVLGPLLDGMAGKVFALLPVGMLSRIRLKLVRAGEPITLEGFLVICAVGAGVFGALGLSAIMASGGALDTKMLGLTLLLTGFGGYMPFMWLSSRVRQRQTAVTKSLPDAFDLITTCVEAGLGLDAALARVAEKVKGPFADDLSVTLREIGMGRQRAEALRELGERTGVKDLVMFVNAIIQAEQLGTSIGQVLRVQSEQMRTRRRQRAEETANQAPVKMVFPLVLCILPALFVVIIGPAAIQLYGTFTQK